MATISIEEAQKKLPEIVHGLAAGEEVVITENNRPVARIVSEARPIKKPPRQLGTMKGTVLHMAPDFDAPLEEFKEYMG